ncbi:hypothetical protein Ddye_023022 [Dipteronia dyeriana]|uniref:Cytochrome P450 n=1 Tax=Dipteronia dyeriana TaxID=168575 RepID=A0AAD9TT21_9ROSI|nr:hypothetical protein Ddye_023002 [Dipteronia dyeriana]KAK2641259.1 hypothetical protein Ddye_023022 [Dipteronia dyeriana]
MEMWFMILVSISIAALLKALIDLFKTSKNQPYTSLPPGPFIFPVIGNFLLLRKSLFELESYIQSLHSKFGPIITLYIGSNPTIFIADRSLAHQALIKNGASFADRPKPTGISKIIISDQHNMISSSAYGPTWRLLRRNLTAEILHPSRSGGPVRIIDHLQFVMFGLLGLMSFGDKLDEKMIKEVQDVQRSLLINFRRFNVLNFLHRVTKFLFRKRWQEFWQLRNQQTSVYMSLIRVRRKIKEERLRKAKEEFLGAGTDTTSTALQWVMANLVKYQNIQEKVFEEIKGVVGIDYKGEIKEDDLQKMPYLKAVNLESLRRYPQAPFVLHAVTEDMVLNGYLIPKNASINFMVAEMGWDGKVWEDPMEFKPERFMKKKTSSEEEENVQGKLVFDITGSREIKMMPFGVGRRICPGLALALLHLEYFVANLVWSFEWKGVDGDEINLEEKQEFPMAMKVPLQAHIIPRSRD